MAACIGAASRPHESRTVRLPRSISEELAANLAGHAGDPEAGVFTAPLGGPLRPHTWVKSFFRPAVRVAGLPEALRLYDLRHTCASLLIAQGASVKAVQAQLGHATASITLDTYGHLFPSELRPWPTGWSRSERPPWRTECGPSADQRS
jgi:integrase